MATVAKRQWKSPGGETKEGWVVRWSDPARRDIKTGKPKRYQKAFDQKKLGDKYRLRVETEIEKGIHTPNSQSLTVLEACKRYIERCEQRHLRDERMARTTLEQTRYFTNKHILPFLGGLKLTQVTPAALQNWVDRLKTDKDDPRGFRTVKRTFQILRAVLTEAQRAGMIGHNVALETPPDMGSKDRGPTVFPSKAEVIRIIAAADGRNRLIIKLAAFCGLRLGEILSLSWGNLLLDQRVVRVRQSINKWGDVTRPKTQASYRDVPLPPGLAEELRAWRASGWTENPGDFVFPTRNGKAILQPDWQCWMWPRILRVAGMPADGGNRLRTHDLRHFAASLFIEQGVAPKRLQYVLGHTSITMTFDRYGHLFPDDSLDKASARIEAEFAVLATEEAPAD